MNGDFFGLLSLGISCGGGLGLAAGNGDAIVILAGRIIIVFLLWSGFLRRCLLFFLKSHYRFTTVPDKVGQLVAEVLVPLFAAGLQAVHGLTLLVEECLRQSSHVRAVLELCGGDLGGLVEVAVSIEELVHLILDLRLQVELF